MNLMPMESSTLVLAVLGLALTVYAVYYRYFEIVQLADLDDPQLMAESIIWIPDHQLARIYSRGGMTRHQWRLLQIKLMKDCDKALGTHKGRGPATLA
ncbi:hypothetical protein RA210_U10386 [Rubrivivax sp. A210]|uniref:hypothetical protein n=1 Tax=Rubrivivax sp. A210 TaxID=2772301 RepID=UPI001917E73D|nr:hypothetical protein [Rubrivivax sp. A210]CAD5366560.1 hypothetical protein RA210_U10386 [Rubrivivax sp. A210]